PPSLPSAATTSAPLSKVTGSTASSSRAASARARRPSVIWHGRFRRSSSVARVTAYGQSGCTAASQPEWLPRISCSPALPQSPLAVQADPHRLDATRHAARHWRRRRRLIGSTLRGLPGGIGGRRPAGSPAHQRRVDIRQRIRRHPSLTQFTDSRDRNRRSDHNHSAGCPLGDSGGRSAYPGRHIADQRARHVVRSPSQSATVSGVTSYGSGRNERSIDAYRPDPSPFGRRGSHHRPGTNTYHPGLNDPPKESLRTTTVARRVTPTAGWTAWSPSSRSERERRHRIFAGRARYSPNGRVGSNHVDFDSEELFQFEV